MPAHKNSFIVPRIPARLVHARARLTCIRPRQLQVDAWPKASSGQLEHHWLRQAQAGCRATGQGLPIRLSGAVPVSLSWQDVNCTATSHLSSRWLFLHQATGRVRRHIRASNLKPCFAAGLGFKEIHVEALPGDVMAEAGGAAGPAHWKA